MGGEDMSETRVIDFPPCPFEDFLKHMNDSDSSEWTWSFMEMCARFGVVFSSPEHTLLARPVNSALSDDDLLAFNDLDPGHPASSLGLTEKHDTWHILYASGDPRFFFSLCPYPLPYVSWHRQKGSKEIRRYDFNTIKSRYGILPTETTKA